MNIRGRQDCTVLTDLLHNVADLLPMQENHKSNDENNYK